MGLAREEIDAQVLLREGLSEAVPWEKGALVLERWGKVWGKGVTRCSKEEGGSGRPH